MGVDFFDEIVAQTRTVDPRVEMHDEVLDRRRGLHGVRAAHGEFEVVAGAGRPEHHAVEAVMALEGAQHLEAEPVPATAHLRGDPTLLQQTLS